jgi:hypothetical protein
VSDRAGAGEPRVDVVLGCLIQMPSGVLQRGEEGDDLFDLAGGVTGADVGALLLVQGPQTWQDFPVEPARRELPVAVIQRCGQLRDAGFEAAQASMGVRLEEPGCDQQRAQVLGCSALREPVEGVVAERESRGVEVAQQVAGAGEPAAGR